VTKKENNIKNKIGPRVVVKEEGDY